MIDNTTVDRIFAAANIVEVVGDFVTLKKKGVNYQACCPFHNEKTPSFVVSPTKGLFKCFGCGKGGNAVTFIMEHEGISYPDALKWVAKKYGIEVQERELTPEDQKKNDDRESMMIVSSYAADYFKQILHNDEEGLAVGMSYFRERGFTDQTIEKFHLGFCPTKGDAFTKTALKEGYQEQYLIDTGLSIKRENGTWYDRFTGRVLFPIHSVSGRIVAFGGRTLRTDKKTAKYVNSPESEIYHKSHTLYGLYQSKKAISQEDCCILVEGYTDVISMHQSGVENVVASSGTSLTEGQIKLIARFSKNVTVIYDGDSAGIKASLRGIDMILREGLNVRVVLLPEGEDPDSFARSHSASELKEYIAENEQDFISFKAKLLMQEATGDPIKRAALITDIVDSISIIPEAITRSVYIKECAMLMRIDEDVLVEEVRRKRRDNTFSKEEKEFFQRREQYEKAVSPVFFPESSPENQKGIGGAQNELERELITYLLRYGCKEKEFDIEGEKYTETVAKMIIEDLENDNIEFVNPTFNRIFQEYKKTYSENPVCGEEEFPMNRFTNFPDAEVCNMVVDILLTQDKMKISRFWSKHDLYINNEEDGLGIAIPKALNLYKSIVVKQMLEELRRKQLELSDLAEGLELALQQNKLNEILKKLSQKYSRMI